MKVTVFTPTYNRAYIINNLYQSLRRQTCKDFEWLVVDDGSTDETEAFFQKIQNEDSFAIRFYKKSNGGKCSAINMGLDLAKGKLFFTVDSDDYLTDDAIEKLISWEEALPVDQNFCGFAGNLGTSCSATPNFLFDSSYFDGTALDRYRQVNGERAMVFYTNIHRKYKYPIFEDERFMTEAVVWNRMANDNFKIRYYNDIIWIYEYREDGITQFGNQIFLNNPQGYGLWLRERADYMNYSRIQKLKMYYTFMCDLSAYCTTNQIASYIGAPKILIKILSKIKTIKNFFCRSSN